MFITESFLLFFLVVFILHFSVPLRFRWIILLLSSYYFYGTIDIRFPLYLIGLTLISYGIGILSDKLGEKRKLLFLIAILIPVFTLIYFKYMNFFSEILTGIFGSFVSQGSSTKFNIILPVGISFYIFRILSYHIDLINNRIKAEKHPGYYALYISFFPQLLAGPIERAIRFIPELREKGRFDEDLFLSGIKLFIYGVFKKVVIADRLAIFVNEVFSSPGSFKGVTPIITAIFFSFQIYCDFSGYSDIAIGLGRVLGYRAKDNFNFPYFSRSISEFWSNWHISLSSWLRDYIFYPVSFSIIKRIDKVVKVRKTSEKITYSIAVIITMFIAGLWHGANWTYIVWGLLLGIFMIFSFVTKKIRKKIVKFIRINRIKVLHSIFRTLFSFSLVTLAWIFFRASSLKEAINFLKSISFGYNGKGFGFMLTSSIILLLFVTIEYISYNRAKYIRIENIHWSLKILGFSLLLSIIIIFGVDSNNEFLYFNF